MKKRQSDSLSALSGNPNIDRLNNAVEDFAMDTINRLRNNIRSYDIGQTGAMFRRLNAKLRFEYGEVDRIAYPMKRSDILREYGVGRGQKRGESGTRTPAPWFSDLWDTQGGTDELADIVARHQADIRAETIADDVSDVQINIRL